MRRPGKMAILAALAALAVAAVAADFLLVRPSPGSARLFPGLGEADIDAVEWRKSSEVWHVEGIGDERRLRLAGGELRPVNVEVVDAFLGAVRIAEAVRYHDRVPASGESTEVVIEHGGQSLRFQVWRGEPVGWVELDGEAIAVTSDVARDLVPEPAVLREDRPFRTLASSTLQSLTIERGEERMSLAGPPWRMTTGELELYADPERVAALERELRGLRFERFRPSVGAESEPELSLTAVSAKGAHSLWVGEACEGGRRVGSEIGQACVDVAALLASLPTPAPPWIDRHLVAPGGASEVQSLRITRGAGPPLDLRVSDGEWRAGEVVLSQEAVVSWLRRLDSLMSEARPAPVLERPRLGSIEIDLASGPQSLTFFHEGEGFVVVRSGENRAFPVDAEVLEVVRADPSVFASLELIPWPREDLVSVAIDGTTVRRGSLLGEWVAEDALIDSQAMERLARTIAFLNASRRLDGAALGPVRRTLELRFSDRMSGQEASFELRVGAARGSGCALGIATEVFDIDGEACAALLAPALKSR